MENCPKTHEGMNLSTGTCPVMINEFNLVKFLPKIAAKAFKASFCS